MKTLNFTKIVGSGNDFILVDRRKENFTPNKKVIQKLCAIKFGVGADGLLLIEKSKKADFKMRIFNSDGSEPTMCGNGARCAAFYYFQTTKKRDITIETGAGILQAQNADKKKIRIKMTNPHSFETNVHMDHNGEKYVVNFIDTGVPHVVIFVSDVDKVDLDKLGPYIRYHKKFEPKGGANVNIVQVIRDNNIKIRTYERGVEDETLACGTGSVAAAVVYANECPLLSYTKAINVHTRSGEALKVYCSFKDNKFYDVWLEGEANVVYQGKIDI